MRNLDLSSWQSVLTSLLALALVTLVGIGLRLVFMLTLQQRRERLNRQINERLKLLIAAYKVLGGSFSGRLTVDPRHRRDFLTEDPAAEVPAHFERSRQIRDAVEGALSDIILLGTEEQVRLAAAAAAALVASLRDFIREALDLDPVPDGVSLPAQGPSRPGGAGAKSRDSGGKGGGGSGGGMGGMGGSGGIGTDPSSEDPAPPR